MKKPRRLTAWLHLPPDVEASAVANGWTLPEGDIRYVSSARGALHRERGALEPRIQGWKAIAYHGRTANDALRMTVVGDDERIATIIRFGTEPAPDVAITSEGFDVVHGGRHIVRADALIDAGEPGIAWL